MGVKNLSLNMFDSAEKSIARLLVDEPLQHFGEWLLSQGGEKKAIKSKSRETYQHFKMESVPKSPPTCSYSSDSPFVGGKSSGLSMNQELPERSQSLFHRPKLAATGSTLSKSKKEKTIRIHDPRQESRISKIDLLSD